MLKRKKKVPENQSSINFKKIPLILIKLPEIDPINNL
jgi:hypothetical protein